MTKQLQDMIEEVEHLLVLKGYAVHRDEIIGGTRVSLVARKEDLLDNLCLLVECAAQSDPVTVETVKQKASVFLGIESGQFLFRLLFVATSDFSPQALAFAYSQPRLLLVTLKELEDQLVDFSPYVNWYLHNYENSLGMFREGRLFETYVELAAREGEHALPALIKRVRQWLQDESNNLLFLLGESGAGKTSFVRYLAYQLLYEKYRSRFEQRFTPLLINLRDYRGATNIQQVVTDALINRYGVVLPPFMALERVCSSGKILIVLDGFDELADRSDKRTIVDCLSQIYILASLNAKVILTCQSNFFRRHADVVDRLRQFSIDVPFTEDGKQRISELALGRHGAALTIEGLDQERVHQYVTNRIGDEADSVIETIKATYNLADLARPILLDMVLTTLPERAAQEERVNAAALYEQYTNRWTARDEWQALTPLEVRQGFGETLAWTVHTSGVREMDAAFLERVMARSLGPLADNEDQIEQLKDDVWTCSFLVRTGPQDEFHFAHPSFVAFFVAKRIVRRLVEGRSRELDQADQDRPQQLAAYPASHPYSGAVYRSLSRRVKSGGGLVALLKREAGWGWPAVAEPLIREHLEAQMALVFGERGGPNDWGVTEEIATFALEYLAAKRTPLDQLMAGIKDEDSLALFGDLLRLNRSPGFARQNSRLMIETIGSGDDDALKVAFCVALAAAPDLVDPDFVRDARERLSRDGWSYFLFALASRGRECAPLLRTCLRWADLRPLDRLICVRGLQDQLPEEVGATVEEMIGQLLESADDQERLLGLNLGRALSQSPQTLERVALQLLSLPPEPELLDEAAAILRLIVGGAAGYAGYTGCASTIQALLAKTDDPGLRKSWRQIERRIALADREWERAIWEGMQSKRTVQKKMWRALRR